LGEDHASKASLTMHPKRSSLDFGYPRETALAKISMQYFGTDKYLELDVSNCTGLILNGLPTLPPAIPGGVWRDGGDLKIEP